MFCVIKMIMIMEKKSYVTIVKTRNNERIQSKNILLIEKKIVIS